MSILYKHISSHCFLGILKVRRAEVTASRRSFIAKQDRKYLWKDNIRKWKYVEHALSRKQDRLKQRTGLASLRGKT